MGKTRLRAEHGVTIIGIDPGVTGAIARLHAEGPPTIVDLPTRQRHNGRTRIDGQKLLDELRRLTEEDHITFIGTEAVHAMPVNGSIGVFSQGSVTGSIEAVLDILQTERPYVQTRHLNPYEWKRHFALIHKDKEEARQKANAIFNSPTSLRRKKDHNRAEAALMALYLRDQVALSLDQEVENG